MGIEGQPELPDDNLEFEACQLRPSFESMDAIEEILAAHGAALRARHEEFRENTGFDVGAALMRLAQDPRRFTGDDTPGMI